MGKAAQEQNRDLSQKNECLRTLAGSSILESFNN